MLKIPKRLDLMEGLKNFFLKNSQKIGFWKKDWNTFEKFPKTGFERRIGKFLKNSQKIGFDKRFLERFRGSQKFENDGRFGKFQKIPKIWFVLGGSLEDFQKFEFVGKFGNFWQFPKIWVRWKILKISWKFPKIEKGGRFDLKMQFERYDWKWKIFFLERTRTHGMFRRAWPSLEVSREPRMV